MWKTGRHLYQESSSAYVQWFNISLATTLYIQVLFKKCLISKSKACLESLSWHIKTIVKCCMSLTGQLHWILTDVWLQVVGDFLFSFFFFMHKQCFGICPSTWLAFSMLRFILLFHVHSKINPEVWSIYRNQVVGLLLWNWATSALHLFWRVPVVCVSFALLLWRGSQERNTF